MKANTRKTLFFSLVLVISFTPLYMYFSHDVAKLKDHYPDQLHKNKTITYPLSLKKPRHWLELSRISANLKGAIILSEDWSFYQHEGVDLNQMAEAFGEIGTRKMRGASTITQQLVKNIFLSSERSLFRKVHEIILAQRVEKVLNKSRILEMYLNSIEYGPGIYGIKRAASHYFQKSAADLTPRESAFIAMLLPSPRRYYVSFKKKKLTPFAETRVVEILGKMRMGKIITAEQYQYEIKSRFAWEGLQQMP